MRATLNVTAPPLSMPRTVPPSNGAHVHESDVQGIHADHLPSHRL